jgi:hypothetical protein
MHWHDQVTEMDGPDRKAVTPRDGRDSVGMGKLSNQCSECSTSSCDVVISLAQPLPTLIIIEICLFFLARRSLAGTVWLVEDVQDVDRSPRSQRTHRGWLASRLEPQPPAVATPSVHGPQTVPMRVHDAAPLTHTRAATLEDASEDTASEVHRKAGLRNLDDDGDDASTAAREQDEPRAVAGGPTLQKCDFRATSGTPPAGSPRPLSCT